MSDEPRRVLRSYRPGEWYGVFGDRATVLLPPGERARVADLWLLLDAGAGFEDTLDALVAGGLRGLPGFVLVSESDGETRIVLRGAARAVLSGADGDVELESAPATTWVERSVRGVTRLRVEVGDDESPDERPDGPPGEDLCTEGGLARVSRVDQPPYRRPVREEPPPHPEPAHPEPEVPEPEVLPGPASRGETPAEPAAEPVPRPGPAAGWAPAPAPPPAYDDAPTEALAVSALRDRAGGGDDLDDADEVTDRFPDQEEEADRPVARLAFSSGERVDVDRVVLVGRAPEARGFAASEQPRIVRVPSPHQEVSSTHLEVRPGTGPDQGVAVVTDLGSTNGTVLLQPGQEALDLRAGLAERLLPGAVLDLGDGVTIRVSEP